MKILKFMIFLIILFLLSACGAVESIPYDPPQTPQNWLDMQPTAEIGDILIVQPSTSLIVYLLGAVTILGGFYVLKSHEGQKARLWWAVALFLWGVGAILAGSSYEAFSYQLKCAGRELCAWTHWLEIVYLLFSLGSVDAMLITEAWCCTTGKPRKGLIASAWVHFALYALLLLIGSLIPVKFLISFELLILFSVPNILIFLYLNGKGYRQNKSRMHLHLLITWGWLILTIAAYFVYYLSGLTARLWEQGIWFSENDVLHIGLIVWMIYIPFVMGKHIRDKM